MSPFLRGQATWGLPATQREGERRSKLRSPNSQLIVPSTSHLILPKSDPFSQTWARQSSWQYVACVCFYSFQLLLPTDDSVDARKANITPHWPHRSMLGLCCHTVFQSHMLLPGISVQQQYFCPCDLKLIWEGPFSRRLCREDESQQWIRQAKEPWVD